MKLLKLNFLTQNNENLIPGLAHLVHAHTLCEDGCTNAVYDDKL